MENFWLHRTLLCLFSLEIYGVKRDKDGRDKRMSFFFRKPFMFINGVNDFDL